MGLFGDTKKELQDRVKYLKEIIENVYEYFQTSDGKKISELAINPHSIYFSKIGEVQRVIIKEKEKARLIALARDVKKGEQYLKKKFKCPKQRVQIDTTRGNK